MLTDFGANVIVSSDYKLEAAKEAAKDIKNQGGNTITVECNVIKDKALEKPC